MGLRVANRVRFFSAVGVFAAVVLALVVVIVHAGGGGDTHLTTATTVRRTTTTSSTTTTTISPTTTTSVVRHSTTTVRRFASATTTTDVRSTRTTVPDLHCTWNESATSDALTFSVTSPDVPNTRMHYYFTYVAPAHGGPSYGFVTTNAQGSATLESVPIDRSMEGGKITATFNTLGGNGTIQRCTSPTYTVHYAS